MRGSAATPRPVMETDPPPSGGDGQKMRAARDGDSEFRATVTAVL